MFKPAFTKIRSKSDLDEAFSLINFHAAMMRTSDCSKSVKFHYRAMQKYLILVRNYYLNLLED